MNKVNMVILAGAIAAGLILAISYTPGALGPRDIAPGQALENGAPGPGPARLLPQADPAPDKALDNELTRRMMERQLPPEPIRPSDDTDSLILEKDAPGGPADRPAVPPGGRAKTAYLTFDDGPSGSTPLILDILRRYGVKATFFVIGNATDEGKSMYKKIVEEGHTLGNHTYSHNYGRIYRSVEAFREDARKLDDLLYETAGVRTDIIRFPGGSNNRLSWRAGGRNVMKNIAREMEKEGFRYFDWNVSSTDAAAPVQGRDEIIGSVAANSRGKNQIIVLMHDSTRKTTTVEALPVVIERLRSDGYVFDVLKKDSFTFQFLRP